MIDLHLLGPVELRGGPGSEALDAVLAQPKRTALLAYLAVANQGSPVRRDRLTGVFWPDFAPSRARAALRRALSFLRTRLGTEAFTGEGREAIGLAPTRLRCDVLRFGSSLEERRLENTLAVYRGPFMDGFFVRDALDFQQWLEGERRRLRWRAERTAVDLAERAEEQADLRKAADWLEKALDISPLSEDALRRLLSVLARAGERTRAVRIFEEFEGRLRDVYQMEPADETRSLVSAISGPAERPGVPWAGPEGPGRARELAEEGWARAERNQADNQRAIELFRRVLRLDESSAEAYAGLAAAYAHGVQLFGRPREGLKEGLRAARVAVTLDQSLTDAHFALGLAFETAGRLAEAETAYRTAVALDPDSGSRMSQLGRAMMLKGEFADSLRCAHRSFRLAPQDPHTSLQIGLDLYCLGHHEEAERWYERTLSRWPDFLWAEASWTYFALVRGDQREAERRARTMLEQDDHSYISDFTAGMTAVLGGDADAASNSFESLYERDPSGRHTGILVSTRSLLAYLKREQGDRAHADHLLREAERANLRTLASGASYGGIFYDQATIWALRGNSGHALDWLEASREAGFLQPGYTRRDPLLESLRGEDRFQRLLGAVRHEVDRQRRSVESRYLG